jgi:hypothetical protein
MTISDEISVKRLVKAKVQTLRGSRLTSLRSVGASNRFLPLECVLADDQEIRSVFSLIQVDDNPA